MDNTTAKSDVKFDVKKLYMHKYKNVFQNGPGWDWFSKNCLFGKDMVFPVPVGCMYICICIFYPYIWSHTFKVDICFNINYIYNIYIYIIYIFIIYIFVFIIYILYIYKFIYIYK